MKKFPLKNYLIVVSVIFVLALLAGAIDTGNNLEASKKSFENFVQFASPLKGKSDFIIFLFIFLNNSVKGLLEILLFVLFGIYAISTIVTNGTMIGTAAMLVAKMKGLTFILAALLPHGILEIPAFLLTSAVSLRLSHLLFQKIFLKERQDIKSEFKKSLVFYLKILLPLYLIAAAVEAFVTPKIIALFE